MPVPPANLVRYLGIYIRQTIHTLLDLNRRNKLRIEATAETGTTAYSNRYGLRTSVVGFNPTLIFKKMKN